MRPTGVGNIHCANQDSGNLCLQLFFVPMNATQRPITLRQLTLRSLFTSLLSRLQCYADDVVTRDEIAQDKIG